MESIWKRYGIYLEKVWNPADSRWISTVLFSLVVTQPNVSLESSWGPPSGLHGLHLRTQSTSHTPYGVQQECTISGYLLLLFLHKGMTQNEHLITWATINATINHCTTKALLATQISHLIYPPSQHIPKADQIRWLCCHVVTFCLPTTTFPPHLTSFDPPNHHTSFKPSHMYACKEEVLLAWP